MKRSKLPLFLFVALPLAISAYWLVSTSRAATESPRYQVIFTDGKCEVREYPELTLASTSMDGAEMNRGFGQLFRFITGRNQAAEKIEMTSPVLIDSAKSGKTMSFIMPKASVEKGVPAPADSSVRLKTVEPARYAVLRFEGGRTQENEAAAIGKLHAWLGDRQLTGKGDPIFAYYDPPWTPIPMRRNEVMIRIEK